MTIKIKTLRISIVFLLLLSLSYFYIRNSLEEMPLSPPPQAPVIEISTTANIGWWPHQEALKIDSFWVDVLESKLNLYNATSLIQYHVKGSLTCETGWRPQIKEVHLSQRLVDQNGQKDSLSTSIQDSSFHYEAIIEFTPIVDVIQDSQYKEEVIPFEFTNELHVESLHWGKNTIRFKCFDLWHDLTLQQSK